MAQILVMIITMTLKNLKNQPELNIRLNPSQKNLKAVGLPLGKEFFGLGLLPLLQ